MTKGRPTKFKKEYIDQAFYLSILGAIDSQMSKFFDVSESTFNLWKKEYPEFSESIKRGKMEADMKIATSLFSRAKGFSKTVQKPIKTKKSVNGEGSSETINMVEVEEYYPPDVTAIIFWLKNRQPELWRDAKTLQGDKNKPLQVQQITGMEIK